MVIADPRSGGEEIASVERAFGERGGGGAWRDGWTGLQRRKLREKYLDLKYKDDKQ